MVEPAFSRGVISGRSFSHCPTGKRNFLHSRPWPVCRVGLWLYLAFGWRLATAALAMMQVRPTDLALFKVE
ncbi:hypothetical protein ABIB14_003192 [Arthrobacter sp. UYEF3]